MTWSGFVAVGVGGAMGCWMRWGLGLALNPLFSSILLGTLIANLVGGYLIGLAVEYFVVHEFATPEIRLFVVAGFLGGLTTFSSFSIEVVELLRERETAWALGLVAAHVLGSLAMTYFGILSVRALQV
jgi:fluoride exporter